MKSTIEQLVVEDGGTGTRGSLGAGGVGYCVGGLKMTFWGEGGLATESCCAGTLESVAGV